MGPLSLRPCVYCSFILRFFRSFLQFYRLPPCNLNRPSRPSLSSLTLCFVPSAVPPYMPPYPGFSSSSPVPVSVRFISSHPIHSRHSHSHICPSIHLLCLLYFLFIFPLLLRWQSRLVVSETIPITVRLWIQSRRQGLCTSTGGCAVKMTLGVMPNAHLRSLDGSSVHKCRTLLLPL